MAKTYDVTPDMLAKLSEGQTFKNFPELARELGVLDKHGKPIAGDSRPSFLGELERFVVLKKDGRQITVERILPEDEILPPRPTGGNRKFVDLIQRLLVYHFNALCQAQPCDGIKLLWEKKDIWETCGMVSRDYRWWGKNASTEDDEIIADAFRKLVGTVKLKAWLDSALYGLKKNDALDYEEKRAFIDYNDGIATITPLTDEQNMTYMRLKAEVLKEYTLSDGRTPATERDLWQTGRMRDFYRKLNPKLEKEFAKEQRYSTIQKVYKIIVEPKTMELFTKRFGKIDPEDVELAVQMMAKLNTVVCDGLLSSTALDRIVYVATRIQDHEDVQKRLEKQKMWGKAPKGSSLDKKIRREFHYKKVQLNDEQKNKMVDNIIRQSPEQLAITLQGKEKGCKVVEKLYKERYVDNFLDGSGLTEEQYEQIMQDAEKESADAELMARLVAEANERIMSRDIKAEEAAILAERQKSDDEIFAEVLAEKERKHPWEKKKERSREMLDCGIPLDVFISQI